MTDATDKITVNTTKVQTHEALHSLLFWAQVVYQVPSDSCAGWPAVNRVSDRPLLLLIVSISVPAEKWDCCGQTQAIDLQLVGDLPGATAEDWEWRPGRSSHNTPRLPVWHQRPKSIWCRQCSFYFWFITHKPAILNVLMPWMIPAAD